MKSAMIASSRRTGEWQPSMRSGHRHNVCHWPLAIGVARGAKPRHSRSCLAAVGTLSIAIRFSISACAWASCRALDGLRRGGHLLTSCQGDCCRGVDLAPLACRYSRDWARCSSRRSWGGSWSSSHGCSSGSCRPASQGTRTVSHEFTHLKCWHGHTRPTTHLYTQHARYSTGIMLLAFKHSSTSCICVRSYIKYCMTPQGLQRLPQLLR